MTTLEEAYATEGIPAPRAKMRHPEHSLQTAVYKFQREYVLTPHLFASHDRAQKHGHMQHMFEKARGQRKGWPDTEIPLLGGMTLRVEMKWGKNKPDDDQTQVIAQLNALGHPTGWTNSVVGWMELAQSNGVQFRPGALGYAQMVDAELVRRFSEPAKPTKAKASRQRKAPTSAAALRAVARARSRGTFI